MSFPCNQQINLCILHRRRPDGQEGWRNRRGHGPYKNRAPQNRKHHLRLRKLHRPLVEFGSNGALGCVLIQKIPKAGKWIVG